MGAEGLKYRTFYPVCTLGISTSLRKSGMISDRSDEASFLAGVCFHNNVRKKPITSSLVNRAASQPGKCCISALLDS
jgi:hypothetical protein